MDNSTTEQKIERLEKELADLREKAAIEKEETAKKVRVEREQDLQKIKEMLEEFNRKYDDELVILKKDIHIYYDSVLGFQYERNYIEV